MRIMGGFGWDHLEFIHGAHGGHGIFWVARAQEILEEIFVEMLLTQEICLSSV